MHFTDEQIHTADPEKLLKQFHPLIMKLANRYYHYLQQQPAYDIDDLYQAGAMALITAQRAYNPEQGCSFISFAYKPIKWHMLRAIGIINGKIPPVLESLDAPLSDDPEAGTLADIIEDPSAPDGLTQAEEQSDREIVRKAVDGIKDDLRRTVIKRIYFDGKNTREVSEELKIKRDTITNAKNGGLSELRRNWMLKEIARSRVPRVSLARFRTSFSSEQETAVLRVEKIIDNQYGQGAYATMRDLLFL